VGLQPIKNKIQFGGIDSILLTELLLIICFTGKTQKQIAIHADRTDADVL
jgi:hypothetical protein